MTDGLDQVGVRVSVADCLNYANGWQKNQTSRQHHFWGLGSELCKSRESKLSNE